MTCPSCRTEIKLTESLAAPLIADTGRRYESQPAQKDAEVAAREAADEARVLVDGRLTAHGTMPILRIDCPKRTALGEVPCRGNRPTRGHPFLASLGAPNG
jgi:hypothetical protein